MPDSTGFNHEPHFGRVYHRCIECGWPGWGHNVTAADREKHHKGHVRDRERALARTQKANLAKARRAKTQLAAENRRAYGEE